MTDTPVPGIDLSPSEQLTYSTVRIECETSGGSSSGTGFFHGFLREGERHVPAVVTNRHVIRGAGKGRFHMTLRCDDGTPAPTRHLEIVLENFEQRWIAHPDPSVDLCIMPIAPLIEEAEAQGERFFFVQLDDSLVPSRAELDELTAMEDVIMIGYPNGIWDSVNNMPIIRQGVTATHPRLDYEGRAEFMIDAACFPGSSGSPVFLFNVGGYPTRGSFVIGSRVKLLGVLYAGPQHTARGEIKIVDVPTNTKPITLSRIPNNLGVVIRSERLRDFNSVLRALVA